MNHGYGDLDAARQALREYDLKMRGAEQNTAARKKIDAEIAAIRAENAKRKQADDERRRQADIGEIESELRMKGATDAEAKALAPTIRQERLRSDVPQADSRLLDYTPLI